jgi:CheY-like chemotaxis protein
MDPFEEFDHILHEMLTRLYDPVYRPPELLWRTLRVSRESGLAALREAILEGIEELKPSPQVPLTARSWRIYSMLHHRYVEGLPQEVTAEKLGITARHLRRSFAEAIHALSMALWEKSGGTLPDAERELPEHGAMTQSPAHAESEVSWQEQLLRELEALQDIAVTAVTNVAETIGGVERLALYLTNQGETDLLVDPVPQSLMAAVHPSALRHILISIVNQLATQMAGGEIRVSAGAADGEVLIHLHAKPVRPAAFQDLEPVAEMLSSSYIATSVNRSGGAAHIVLKLLQVDRRVLVVDDNLDMAHLYGRYLTGTRYHLHHVDRGEKIFAAIELHKPHLIVLDVMLPDIDGWDVLSRLRENPDTRRLPVVICSVMPEKQLAEALGARYFLAKPVQRHEFIAALETVLPAA